MREIYFGDFRKIVMQHCREIQARDPAYQSTEWFLLRYLKRIEKNTNPPTTPERVENSMRGLIRFYVDMLEENSQLGDHCMKVYQEYHKALRRSQEE